MTLRLENNLSRSFEVVVNRGLIDIQQQNTISILDNRRVLVITTPTVHDLYGDQMRNILASRPLKDNYVVVFELSETRKTIESVQEVCALAVYHGLGRKDVIVAFGGGVCSDVVGFAASMFRRGISHVRVPTTLIGQIDAGIGIKGGVNYRSKKNILGCFHPPEAVLIDPSVLATLRAPHIRQGLSEIIKLAVIMDRGLFDNVKSYGRELISSKFQHPGNVAQAVILRAIELTLGELQQNSFEDQTLERLLDFGHTFSPLIEEETGFTISHGEAVAIDMALTCSLAAELGIMPIEDFRLVVDLLKDLGLPVWSPLLTVDLCKSAIRHTRAHRGGVLNLVVPTKIGAARFLKSHDRLEPEITRHCIDNLFDIDQGGKSAGVPSHVR